MGHKLYQRLNRGIASVLHYRSAKAGCVTVSAKKCSIERLASITIQRDYETRREERIGQLLQELKRSDNYILKTPPPCLGFRR